MFKVVTLEQGSNEWLLWRNQGIGGSDIATLLKGSKKSINNLYFEKIGAIRGFQGNEATRHGHKYEPLVRQRLMDKSKWDIKPLCVESTNPELGAHFRVSLDGIVANTAIVEIKCPFVQHSDLYQGVNFDCAEGDIILSPNEDVINQIQYQLLVTGYKTGIFVVYNSELDKYWKAVVHPDIEKQTKIKDTVNWFWNCVVNQIVPFADANERPVEFDEEADSKILLQTFRQLKLANDEAIKQMQSIETILKDRAKLGEVINYPGIGFVDVSSSKGSIDKQQIIDKIIETIPAAKELYLSLDYDCYRANDTFKATVKLDQAKNLPSQEANFK